MSMDTPHVSPSPEYVLDAITDPQLDERLGFSLLDANPNLTDETNVGVLEQEFNEASPLVVEELVPVIKTAREHYVEMFSSYQALNASLNRWTTVYNETVGREGATDSILEAIAAEGFERFFSGTIDALPLPEADKIMIAHISAILDHPGEKMGEPSNHGLFEAAANYIGRQQDRLPEDVSKLSGEQPFADFVVDSVASTLANDAFNDLFELTDAAALEARKDYFTEVLGLDLKKYLETVMLDWEILPPGTGEEMERLEGEARDQGWTFDRDRYLFLRSLQYATNGIMYRSSDFTLKTERGYYLAVWAQDENGDYAVVADNPINPERQENAVYIAVESKIAKEPVTDRHYGWDEVLSEDKATARALGAIKRKHTSNYKENVIDSLPKDLRAKIRSLS